MSRLIARSFPDVQVVGIDIRDQYLDYARARARAEGIHNLTFERANVFALPFADARFDLVWSKYLLQWLREPKAALSEFKRVAKSGGHVVSCDYVGCAVEHFPIDPELEKKGARHHGHIGRRQYRPQSAGLYDGARFSQRRGRDRDRHIVHRDRPHRQGPAAKSGDSIPGHAAASDQDFGVGGNVTALVDRFLAHYDDPSTCSFTSLHFTRGQV
jgi:SAM-dependent methyltransferase